MVDSFLIQENRYVREYAMVRFARRRVSDLATVLKPLIPGLSVSGTKKLTRIYILSDKVDDAPGAKRIETTKSYGAAIRPARWGQQSNRRSPLRSLRLLNHLPLITELKSGSPKGGFVNVVTYYGTLLACEDWSDVERISRNCYRDHPLAGYQYRTESRLNRRNSKPESSRSEYKIQPEARERVQA